MIFIKTDLLTWNKLEVIYIYQSNACLYLSSMIFLEYWYFYQESFKYFRQVGSFIKHYFNQIIL